MKPMSAFMIIALLFVPLDPSELKTALYNPANNDNPNNLSESNKISTKSRSTLSTINTINTNIQIKSTTKSPQKLTHTKSTSNKIGQNKFLTEQAELLATPIAHCREWKINSPDIVGVLYFKNKNTAESISTASNKTDIVPKLDLLTDSSDKNSDALLSNKSPADVGRISSQCSLVGSISAASVATALFNESISPKAHYFANVCNNGDVYSSIDEPTVTLPTVIYAPGEPLHTMAIKPPMTLRLGKAHEKAHTRVDANMRHVNIAEDKLFIYFSAVISLAEALFLGSTPSANNSLNIWFLCFMCCINDINHSYWCVYWF